ncbi:efflux RND transporter periplasmic adaptor subunit [Glaciimonas sp. GS1]|uniref:Efflux RND transporter periplasmic adaptor subunit n=2 Tax=Glaciimonas soli TaxID=2590999 RepID=A0A843YPS8_9BURK|nr:efflux RND transporter periplasmic adaptor subunit [Glaciimonas soli]
MAALLSVTALTLTACSKTPPPTEDIRPVRVMTLSAADTDTTLEFPGEVRARYESQLGFRIGGKIIARKVDVGSVVKRGQVLMQLDAEDVRLAQMQSSAALRSAESNRDLAKADLQRYQELRAKNFVSQAVIEQKESAFKVAQASYDQAVAGLKGQSNQAAYTTLSSDVDGVVTAVTAEVGQVVAAGTPVVTVAKSGEKEVVVSVPENQVELFRHGVDAQVRLWADHQQTITGTVREVSPIADAATRTYVVKIAIPDSTPNVKLGMTAYATFIVKHVGDNAGDGAMAVPLSAIYQTNNQNLVWVVEKNSVHTVPVQVSGHRGNDALIKAANEGALSVGQQIVTAGVHLLKPGQKVTILGAEDSADGVKQ